MNEVKAYGTKGPTNPLEPIRISRKQPGPFDVVIEILFCGVCHSDLHTARNEWGNTLYPCVPGHEIIGRVLAVGNEVSRFKEGDIVGVGCMVDSCGQCESCLEGLEQYCEVGFVATYNGRGLGSENTFGGYSETIVVKESFVLKVRHLENLAAVAPLLCAGITTYSPLKHWGVGPGKTVGVVGLGGLGHMAIKIAHAMGAEVVLFTTSPNKAKDAKRLGADDVVISKSPDSMVAQKNRFHVILDTVSAPHALDPYLDSLKRDGALILVGAPPEPHPSPNVFRLINQRRQIAGSLIGGIQETQEMLDFCADHGIVSDIERIPIQAINEAYERMLKSDVKYRFVIDVASLR